MSRSAISHPTWLLSSLADAAYFLATEARAFAALLDLTKKGGIQKVENETLKFYKFISKSDSGEPERAFGTCQLIARTFSTQFGGTDGTDTLLLA